IVEAVPQPILLAGTVASGLVFGFLLALGTGDWWMSAVIAAHGVGFGVTDPLLHRDVGYYLGTLPWSEQLRALALAAVSTAAPVVAALGAAATAASVVWGVREKPLLLFGAWGALLAASLLGFVLIPGSLSGRGGQGATGSVADTARAAAARQLEQLAFGVTERAERPPPGFPSPEAAVAALPVWNAARVVAAASQHRELLGPGAR